MVDDGIQDRDGDTDDSGDTKVIQGLPQGEDIGAAVDSLQGAPKVKKSIPAKIIQRGQKLIRNTWLNKNIQSILALMVLSFAFAFFMYVLKFDFSEPSKLKDIVVLLIGIVSTLVTMVITYYFGSSKGSSDKADHIMNGK